MQLDETYSQRSEEDDEESEEEEAEVVGTKHVPKAPPPRASASKVPEVKLPERTEPRSQDSVEIEGAGKRP